MHQLAAFGVNNRSPQRGEGEVSELILELVKKLQIIELATKLDQLNTREENNEASTNEFRSRQYSWPEDRRTPQMKFDSLSPSTMRCINCGSSDGEASPNSSKKKLYKTELCTRFLMSSTGACEYGPRCQFAHGLRELHLTTRHPRYKTEICRNYQLTGFCRYRRRCDFIHDESTLQLDALRTENALYQAYCKRHTCVTDVTLLEVLREFAPAQPELRQFLQRIESKN